MSYPDAPTLWPTIEANEGNIRSDLMFYGVAYIWRASNGKEWLIHPNSITIRTEGNEDA